TSVTVMSQNSPATSLHGSPTKSDASTLLLCDHLDVLDVAQVPEHVAEPQVIVNTVSQKVTGVVTTPDRKCGPTPCASPTTPNLTSGLTPLMSKLLVSTPPARGQKRGLITTPETTKPPTTPQPVKRLRRTVLLGESVKSVCSSTYTLQIRFVQSLLDSPVVPLQKRLQEAGEKRLAAEAAESLGKSEKSSSSGTRQVPGQE
ncbi:unnamed protein product, partial [Symbiodinium sp. CCMP2456]